MDTGSNIHSTIAELNQDVDRIATGDLSHRVGTDWETEELADLAASINEVVRDIEGAIIEIQSFGMQFSMAMDQLSTRTAELETQAENARNAVDGSRSAVAQQSEQLRAARSQLSRIQRAIRDITSTVDDLDSFTESEVTDDGAATDSVSDAVQRDIREVSQAVKRLSTAAEQLESALEAATKANTETTEHTQLAVSALESQTETLDETIQQTTKLADVVSDLGQTLRTFSAGAAGDQTQVALLNSDYEAAVEYIETNNETLLARSEAVVVAYTEQEDRDFTDEVNIAGRQRMLSQRIAKKTLYIARNERAGGKSTAVRDAKADLQEHVEEFDHALETLSAGGTHRGIDLEPPPPEILNELDETRAVWVPFKENAQTVVEQSRFSQEFVDSLGL